MAQHCFNVLQHIVVESRLHKMKQWYLVLSDFFLNNPSLDMGVVLSMIFIASLMSINPVNPRKNMQSGLHMKR